MAKKSDEYKLILSAEDQGAKRAVEQQTEAEKKMAEGTKRTGDEAKQAGDKVGGLGGAVASMKNHFMGFLAIAGSIVAAFQSITDHAVKMAIAVRDAGHAARDVMVNLGALRGREVTNTVSRIAVDQSMGLAERANLMGTAGVITSLNPNLSNEEYEQQLRRFGGLQEVSGLHGQGAVTLVNLLRSRGGLEDAQAFDTAGALATGPLGADGAIALLERGGMQALQLALASAPHALDPKKLAEQIPAMMDRINALDPRQQRRMGITGDMDLASAMLAMSSSGMTPDQIVQALGGEQYRGPIESLMQTVADPQALDNAMKQMMDAGFIDRTVADLQSDPFYRAARVDAQRELSTKLGLEQPGLRQRFGSAYEDTRQSAVQIPLIGSAQAFMQTVMDPDTWWSEQTVADRQRHVGNVRRNQLQGGGGGTRINIQNQYNTGSGRSPLETEHPR